MPRHLVLSAFLSSMLAVSIAASQQPATATGTPLPATAAASSAASSAPATREQIVKLFHLMRLDQQAQTMMHTMQGLTQARLAHSKYTPQQRADMTKLMSDLQEQAMGKDFVNGLIDLIVPIYQRHFTGADVDAMIAFYSTPSGQKVVRELPAVTMEFMAEMIPCIQNDMQQAMKKVHFTERLIAIQAEGAPSPAAH